MQSYDFSMEPTPSFLSNSLNIPLLTPQSEIFEQKPFLIISHLLFIRKFYIYNSRSSSKLNIARGGGGRGGGDWSFLILILIFIYLIFFCFVSFIDFFYFLV